MKILKGLLIGIGFIFIAGFFMPGVAHIERQLTIQAQDSVIFAQIIDLKNWGNWSAWHKIDPNTIWQYSPTSAGIGASYTWSSENKQLGKGQLTLVDAKSFNFIRCRMAFGNMVDATSEFKLTAKDSTTTLVTWTLNSDNGLNPIKRWMSFMMNSFVGPDYEKGLANLKTLTENK